MNELALFAGAGGGILGGKLLGWRTVCAVEWEPYPASVLCARQNDEILPPFPIWDDVRTFDGKPWRGIVDVVSGGFPCQDISAAGHGAGISGSRSGLWSEMARIIGEIRPRYAFVENSPMLTSRGLGTVLGDLAALGFDARWGVVSAADVGAPHLRERIWIVATNTRYKQPGQQKGGFRQERNESVGQITSDICANLSDPDSDGCNFILQREGGRKGETQCATVAPSNQRGSDDRKSLGNSGQITGNGDVVCGRKTAEISDSNIYSQSTSTIHAEPVCKSDMAEPQVEGLERRTFGRDNEQALTGFRQGCQPIGTNWRIEPDVGRVANGVAARVDRLKAIGNGQVPAVAATAFKLLAGEF